MFRVTIYTLDNIEIFGTSRILPLKIKIMLDFGIAIASTKYINELLDSEEAYYNGMANKLSSFEAPRKHGRNKLNNFPTIMKRVLPPIEHGTPTHYSNHKKDKAFNNF